MQGKRIFNERADDQKMQDSILTDIFLNKQGINTINLPRIGNENSFKHELKPIVPCVIPIQNHSSLRYFSFW